MHPLLIVMHLEQRMVEKQKTHHLLNEYFYFVIYNNSSTSELFNEIDKIIKTINE